MRAAFYARDTLTHRDFLGSLMGSGIKRETVGDIYVAGGSCDFLVLREILPYVLQNLTSAGRTKLSLQEISLADIQLPQQAVKTVRDTVPSLRLDGIISSGFSISRGKAADYVSAGKAELNYLPCMKGDKQVSEGDLVSVRGLGKLRLEKVGGNTKKGRISINGALAKAARTVKPGDVIQVRKPPVTYSFKVLQPIEKRVGAKLVAEMMENVTTPEQYELLEMSRISGFVNRAKGTGRPTKKDRRSLEEFTEPEFLDDFDFEFDFEEE